MRLCKVNKYNPMPHCIFFVSISVYSLSIMDMKRVIFTILISLFSLTFLSASNSGIAGNETDIMDFLKEAASMNREYDSIISIDRSLRPRLQNEFSERLSRFDGELTRALSDVYLTRMFGRYGERSCRFYEYVELVAKADFGVRDSEVLDLLESVFGHQSHPDPVSSKEFLIAMLALRNEVSPEKIESLDILAQISESEFNRMWYQVYRNQLVSTSDIEELRGLNELIYRNPDTAARIIAEVRKLEIERSYRYSDEKETSAVMKALYERAQQLLETVENLPEKYASLANSLKRFKSSLDRSYFTAGLCSSQVYPGESVVVNINGFNVEGYEAVLYELPARYRYRNVYDNQEYETMIADAQTLDRKTVRVKLPFFGIYKNASAEFGNLSLGDYLITVSDGKSKEYLRFSSSSLFVAFRSGIQGMEAFVADAKSGAPYDSADLNVFSRIFDNGRSVYVPDYSRRLQLGTGFTAVAFNQKDREENTWYFNFSKGEDVYAPVSYFYDYPERKRENGYRYVATLLADRPLYSYGDRIRTKVIVNDVEAERVAEGVELDVKVEDSERNVVFTGKVMTDEYGSAVIDFMPDKSVRAGMLSVKVSSADEQFRLAPAYRPVRLEDYYVPAFRLELDRPDRVYSYDDRFVLTGHAETYSGIPMAGIEVKVKYGTSGYLREAVLSTDEDGAFVFETDLEDFSLGRRRYAYNFSVEVLATSLTGEQISAGDYYMVGNTLSIQHDFPDIVFSDDRADYGLKLSSLGREIDEAEWSVSVDGKEHAGVSGDINEIKNLKPGAHDILIESEYQGQQVSLQERIIVLDRQTKTLPKGVDTVMIASIVQKENSVSVFTGTTEKNLHVLVECLEGKKVLSAAALHLKESSLAATALSFPPGIPQGHADSFP